MFNTILVWSGKNFSLQDFDSVVGLLGHVTCSVLVPAMVIPVMEMLCKDENEGSSTQAAAEVAD